MEEISIESSKFILNGMCTEKFKKDFSNTIKTRYPLFYITTNDENRFLTFMEHFCIVGGYECYTWDCYNGLIYLLNGESIKSENEDLKSNPLGILDHISGEINAYDKKGMMVQEKKSKGVNGVIYILLDFFRFIGENPDIERRFKSIAYSSSAVSTIITGPSYKTTDVLSNIIPVIEFPYANKNEIKRALYAIVDQIEIKLPGIKKETFAIEEDLINAVRGLTIHEAQTAFSKSIVDCKGWDINIILGEKKQIIQKSGILEYYDRSISMDSVGGLKNLVKWVKNRKKSFSQEAEDYGIKKPKGLLTIGMPGCVLGETKIKIKKIRTEGNIKTYIE